MKAGWANPAHFPVGAFWDYWPGGNGADARAEVQHDKNLGLNFYTHGNRDQSACVLRDVGGMSWLGEPGSLTDLSTCGETVWPGNYLEDELDGTSGSTTEAFAELTRQQNAARTATPNKFVGVNYTSIPIQIWTSDANGGRYINGFGDLVSSDDYLFSTPNRCEATWSDGSAMEWWPFIGPRPASVARCRDGQSYGKLTDGLRSRDALDGARKPVASFLEVYGGADPAAKVGSPAQVKAAAMSNLIHGAEFLIWFPLSFHSSCVSNRLLSAASPPCAAAHKAAVGEINNLVKSLAPVLNTQSYQWTFGAGLETMLKVYNGQAYVFAMTDGGTGARTFTLPAGLTGNVTDEAGRTIPVSGGRFTDTFEANTEYHVYRIAVA